MSKSVLLKDVPDGWDKKPLPSCVDKSSIPRDIKILQSEYLKSGKYPIIDQGAEFVAGFTDDESKLYKGNLPVVVFGDHTRVLKYVDFQFSLGADGTKLLCPKSFLVPKYFYYYLLHVPLESKGYNRHYKYLKEKEIIFPKKSEQGKVAFVLSEIHRAIEQQEQIIAKTKELKRSLMHRLFTYGLRGEELKETEIGLMPESWNLVSIGELIANKVLFIQNGFPCGKWNDKGIGILQLRPFNISDEGYIDLNTVKHIQTDKKIDSYLLRNEDVIFNNTNSEKLVGKTALWQAEKEAVLSNHMTIIRISKKDKLVPLYLARLLHKKWFDKYFRSICQRHVNQASVGVERIKGVRLGLPSIAEQKEIASVFYQLDQKICNENIKKMNLESFFKSMLQLLMTGQVRVKDIDFGEDYE